MFFVCFRQMTQIHFTSVIMITCNIIFYFSLWNFGSLADPTELFRHRLHPRPRLRIRLAQARATYVERRRHLLRWVRVVDRRRGLHQLCSSLASSRTFLTQFTIPGASRSATPAA